MKKALCVFTIAGVFLLGSFLLVGCNNKRDFPIDEYGGVLMIFTFEEDVTTSQVNAVKQGLADIILSTQGYADSRIIVVIGESENYQIYAFVQGRADVNDLIDNIYMHIYDGHFDVSISLSHTAVFSPIATL